MNTSFDYNAVLTFLTENPLVALAIAGFAVLVLILKWMALWRAARNNSPIWFVVLAVINTAGILEILYLTIFGKKRS